MLSGGGEADFDLALHVNLEGGRNVLETEAALRVITSLAHYPELHKVNPDVAASVRKGLAETLDRSTSRRHWIDLKTVDGANPIESMIEIVRDHPHHVKRWRWATCGCAGRLPACSNCPGSYGA